MKTRVRVALLAFSGAALATTACGSSGVSPSGSYPYCYFVSSRSTGDPGASGTLTLRQSATAADVSYGGGEELPAFTVTMASTSDTSATLSPAGQTLGGAWGHCGGGVSSANDLVADPAPAAGTVSLTSGALTFDESSAFLSLVGTVIDVEGSAGCSVDPGPTAVTLSISCTVSP